MIVGDISAGEEMLGIRGHMKTMDLLFFVWGQYMIGRLLEFDLNIFAGEKKIRVRSEAKRIVAF